MMKDDLGSTIGESVAVDSTNDSSLFPISSSSGGGAACVELGASCFLSSLSSSLHRSKSEEVGIYETTADAAIASSIEVTTTVSTSNKFLRKTMLQRQC